MAFKFIVFAAFVAVAHGASLAEYSHASVATKYSDATAVSYSSVSAPVAAPAYPHAAPVYSHATPSYSHGASSYSHAAPSYSHASPSYSHAVPSYQPVAPAVSHYSAPVQKVAYSAPAYGKYVEEEGPAHYQYSYAVNDEHTGDIKTAEETRDGDAVKGSYTLVDADGYKRIVEYTADKHNGFNAVVRREPINQKVAYAAPVAKYAAPVASYAHAAPAYNQHY